MNSSTPVNKKSASIIMFLAITVFLLGNGLAQAVVIEGKFDAPNGMNVISGDFVATTLAPGSVPVIDAQIQAAFVSGGFSYIPLGMSFTGEVRGCKNGIFFGNLYATTDPRITALWGVDAIIFIPAGMLCGTGLSDTPFGAGEALLVFYVGPQVPSGYFGSADLYMISGSSIAVSDGIDGMFLRLSIVP